MLESCMDLIWVDDENIFFSHLFGISAGVVEVAEGWSVMILSSQDLCIWPAQAFSQHVKLRVVGFLSWWLASPRGHIQETKAEATGVLCPSYGSQRHSITDKDPASQSYGFSSSHVWMWELDDKESWALKNWCFWRRLLRVPWTARRSNQSILKEISPGCSLEGVMLKLKLPILWPPEVKSWLTGKHPDAGKDWRWEEKGMTEDEMVGWHHWLNGHGFE